VKGDGSTISLAGTEVFCVVNDIAESEIRLCTEGGRDDDQVSKYMVHKVINDK
jgi:hypothetical protein